MTKQEKVYERLNSLKIEYEVTEHPAVYTIDEMDLLYLNEGNVVKNLFLRDFKGKRHFLVVVDKNKKVDLKDLREQLKSTSLSFASEERLQKHLQLSKGSVSPLGIINDEKKSVEVIFDQDLIGEQKLGVHPNENTATVWISFDNLKALIEDNGHILRYVTI